MAKRPKNPINHVTDEIVQKIIEANSIDVFALEKLKVRAFKCGIYFLHYQDEIVYVGKSINIEFRISNHITENEKIFTHYSFLLFEKEDLDFYERFFINKLKPLYNKDTLTKKHKNDALHNNN